jgi:hypothetical protein
VGGRRIFSLGAAFALVLALSPASRATTTEPPVRAAGMAIPLEAPTPEWYTDALHKKVVAAGARGKTVPLPAGVEVDSALLFTGIRPGSWMIFPAWCTMNFVFGNPDAGTTSSGPGNGGGGGKPSKGGSSGVYIGTAGHCTETGEEVTIIAAPGVLMNIGTTVKSVDNGIGDDFALIEIRPEMVQYVNPSMAIVAGPTASKTPAFGDPVVHVGHGLVVGTGGTPRAGLVTWTGGGGKEASGYGWDGAAAPGDSGSGVRAASGEAVGNLTHLMVGTRYLPAYIGGTNIDRILQIAGAPLATASLVPNPLP